MLPVLRIKRIEDSLKEANAERQKSDQEQDALRFHYCPTNYTSKIKVAYGQDEKTKGTTSAKKKYQRTNPEILELKLFFNDIGTHENKSGANVDRSTDNTEERTRIQMEILDAILRDEVPDIDVPEISNQDTVSGIKRKTVAESLQILRNFSGGQGSENSGKVPAPVLELIGLRERPFVCVISKMSIKTYLFDRVTGKPVRADVNIQLVERVGEVGLVEDGDGRLYFDILTDKGVEGLDREIGDKFADTLIEKETVSSAKLRAIRKSGR